MNQLLKNTIILLLFLMSILTLSNAAAQNNDSTQTYNSLLWEISGNGLSKPSYIFGTIHLIPKAEFIFSEVMSEKFKQTDKLVLEIDIDLSLKEQIALVQKIMLPENKELSSYMSEKEYADFKGVLLDTFKIKKSMFNKIIKIKPILSAGIVCTELIEKPIAYENELAKRAKKQKKEIIGLETADFQIDLINKISIEDQVKITYGNNQTRKMLIEYFQLLEVYKTGDLSQLMEKIGEDESFKGYEADLINTRNQNWIPKIEEIIKTNSAFIAVGAGHLPGNNGILKLLEKNGYKLTAVD